MTLVARIAAVGADGSTALSWPLRLAYYLYERRLLVQVGQGEMPRHIGIILDGNRRYGQQRQLTDPRTIYSLGAEKLDAVLEWCADLGIAAVTLWVFSTDNQGRSAREVSGILGAVEEKLRRLAADPQIHRRRVRVRAVGRLAELPESTRAAIADAESATRGYDGLYLTIAVAYGGREEITDAVRKLVAERLHANRPASEVIGAITPNEIGRYIYAADLPDPDLIIRTSGELRLSGFLLWQSAYSEFYFSDVYWPAFRKIDFLRAVRDYQRRRRRYGL